MGKRIEVKRSLSDIAANIDNAWSNVDYGARPYLNAMYHLNDITDKYGVESGETIVRYFLANATSFKGEAAKTLKTELKQLLKTTH